MLKKSLSALVAIFLGCFGIKAQTKTTPTNSKPTPAVTEGVKNNAISAAPPADTAKKTTTSFFPSLTHTLGKALESFMPLQFKYAIMLNEAVEKVTNVLLYKNIDDWYGTRYRFGGTSERGIDCSAFMQVLANYSFGWVLPRTAREQFYSMMRINKEELKEGDFVFFNTRGGVSHVGMYLQNNKFVHAASSNGVMISDLNDKYWSNKFLGARRVLQAAAASIYDPASRYNQP